MKLAYIDESERGDKLFLGGVLLSEDAASRLDEEISYFVKTEIFGTSDMTSDTELHANTIVGGKKNFAGVDKAKRALILATVARLVMMRAKARVIGVCISHFAFISRPRPEGDKSFPHTTYTWALNCLLSLLIELDAPGWLFVTADNNAMQLRKTVAWLARRRDVGYLDSNMRPPTGAILDTIHFVDSKYSRLVQVADIIVYMAQRYHHLAKPPLAWERPAFDAWTELVMEQQGKDRQPVVFRFPEDYTND